MTSATPGIDRARDDHTGYRAPMRIYLVDAFTNKAFAGNPAAVVLLDEPADPA